MTKKPHKGRKRGCHKGSEDRFEGVSHLPIKITVETKNNGTGNPSPSPSSSPSSSSSSSSSPQHIIDPFESSDPSFSERCFAELGANPSLAVRNGVHETLCTYHVRKHEETKVRPNGSALHSAVQRLSGLEKGVGQVEVEVKAALLYCVGVMHMELGAPRAVGGRCSKGHRNVKQAKARMAHSEKAEDAFRAAVSVAGVHSDAHGALAVLLRRRGERLAALHQIGCIVAATKRLSCARIGEFCQKKVSQSDSVPPLLFEYLQKVCQRKGSLRKSDTSELAAMFSDGGTVERLGTTKVGQISSILTLVLHGVSGQPERLAACGDSLLAVIRAMLLGIVRHLTSSTAGSPSWHDVCGLTDSSSASSSPLASHTPVGIDVERREYIAISVAVLNFVQNHSFSAQIFEGNEEIPIAICSSALSFGQPASSSSSSSCFRKYELLGHLGWNGPCRSGDSAEELGWWVEKARDLRGDQTELVHSLKNVEDVSDCSDDDDSSDEEEIILIRPFSMVREEQSDEDTPSSSSSDSGCDAEPSHCLPPKHSAPCHISCNLDSSTEKISASNELIDDGFVLPWIGLDEEEEEEEMLLQAEVLSMDLDEEESGGEVLEERAEGELGWGNSGEGGGGACDSGGVPCDAFIASPPPHSPLRLAPEEKVVVPLAPVVMKTRFPSVTFFR